jgi:hypothetical protein
MSYAVCQLLKRGNCASRFKLVGEEILGFVVGPQRGESRVLGTAVANLLQLVFRLT